MKHGNKSGVKPEIYQGFEILIRNGMRFAVVDRQTYYRNPQRAREQILRDASLSLKKLENLDSTKIIVGVTGTGVDAVVRHQAVQSWELTHVVDSIPNVLARTLDCNGVETFFVRSTGLENMTLHGLEVLVHEHFVILPSPITNEFETAQWISVPESIETDDVNELVAALEKWRIQAEKELAYEQELNRVRAYIKKRNWELVSSKASRLNKSIAKVRNSSGLNKFEMARKQCYSLGHFTDNDPQLNEIILESLVKEVLVGNSFTSTQITEIIERLSSSLKAGIADQKKVGKR